MLPIRFAPSVFAFVLLAGPTLLPLTPARAADPEPKAAPAVDEAFLKDVETFRQERIDGLKKPEGWLSLVGLFWLQEGDNRFGSGAENRVIFPEGSAPEVAGNFVRRGDKVTVEAAAGAGLTSDAKPVTRLDLAVDADKDGPTHLELGSLRFYVIKRGDRLGVRVKDTTSPLVKNFPGIDTYPTRAEWRFEAKFEPYVPVKKVPVPNILGQVEDVSSAGAVVFEIAGKTYRLDGLGEPGEGLSLIFADDTNGNETYGAGRFLDTDPPKDGKVVVDFNKAYNPPCAFTAFATCPLPPKQNRLALRVEAGEKKFAGGPHH
ncbi:MAG TPA: DUF1684 domain-containing protein [Thermoanaerobaculia bacterium]|jgi:uncharacterized protein (DUF1684 family)|nr:DUF1684 domain-containing protein [Thermoanaerobaculia bacterium]